jgi:hypothetical protein
MTTIPVVNSAKLWGLSLLILSGGYIGWSVYQMRLRAAASDLEPRL